MTSMTMRDNPRLSLGAWFAFVFLLARCSMNLSSGGSGGETGNPVILGKVVDSTGRGLSNMKISAIKISLDPLEGISPADSFVAETGTNGAFRIEVTKNDTFNILAEQSSQLLSGLATRIAVLGPVTSLANTIVAKSPGAIRILLGKGIDTVDGYVYIPGTHFYSLVTNSDSVVLNNVPAAAIPSLYYKVKNVPSSTRLISGDAVVSPNKITTIAYVTTKKVFFNTTASGAGVTGNVIAFPVLVRLTSANFDFSQTEKNGEDIRFAKSDDSPIPFEIEQWDSSNARAEIWVRVDTIYGNDSTHYMAMTWGNPAAGIGFESRRGVRHGLGFSGRVAYVGTGKHPCR